MLIKSVGARLRAKDIEYASGIRLQASSHNMRYKLLLLVVS